MNLLTVDFETYYDKEYSLSKMQTDAYVLDGCYQTIGVSVKDGDGPIQWFSGSEAATKAWLDQFPWATSAVVCHNTLFDGFILTQRFGIKPKLWMDTKSMAMMLFPYLASYSLANLAKHFKLAPKGTYVNDALGKRREAFMPHEMEAYAEYCRHDVELTHRLAEHFIQYAPPLELKLIDMTVRMFTEPQFVGDPVEMRKLYDDEVYRKVALLARAAVDKDIVMSNNKFADALRMLGVEPPTKISPTTGKTVYAFAKSDKEFIALEDHENSDVQALVAARLGVKTTIAETRARRMLETSQRTCLLGSEVHFSTNASREALRELGEREGGALPVYLNYWGAKTTGRYSGGNQINWQNIPARGPSAGLRYAIRAPKGHSVLVGDSSNIELRVAMCAAGQDDVVTKIASGQDLYCDFATRMFGRTITKGDKKERMLGKIAMLSLQYGAGWVKFKEMVRIQSNEILADNSAEEIVKLYRRVHGDIVGMWLRFENVILPEIHNGSPSLIAVDKHGWCIVSGEGFGVNGGPGVVYHNLRQEQAEDRLGRPMLQWVYTMGKEKVALYGGKCFENYCQHVARQIVMWQTARLNERYPVALSVHDEAVCVVKNSEVDAARAYMEECLSMAPPWCRDDIPLACETGVGQSYGDAK